MSRATTLPRTSGRKTDRRTSSRKRTASTQDNNVHIQLNKRDTRHTTIRFERKKSKEPKEKTHESLEEDSVGKNLGKKMSVYARKQSAMRSTIKYRLTTIARKTEGIPNLDSSKGLSAFTSRKLDDHEQRKTTEDYDTKPVLGFKPDKFVPKNFLLPDRYPSYNRFKMPYNISCNARYSEARIRYEKQFQREIQNLIDYQDTASDAACLTRHMAYTTLWPPLHNEKEVDTTSKLLKPLTEKERRRLRFIMENDIH